MTANFSPRKWQHGGANQCVSRAKSGADRALISACPGSGKTFGGLHIATQLIERAGCSPFIVVVTPNIAIRTQWVERATQMGIQLSQIRDARVLHQQHMSIGRSGYVLSYQQAINMKQSLRLFCDNHRPIVILDEVHHTAGTREDRDGNAWGHAVEVAFASARFKLCTTGTPFREDTNIPIAFVDYDENGVAIATYSYSYKDAIQDGVCRPIEFEFYDGYVEWTSKRGQVVSADFGSPLSKPLARERLEAALSTDGDFPLKMLEAANQKLTELRAGSGVDANAAGLAVAINRDHAESIADALMEISGIRPVIVHDKIDDAQGLIDRFRGSNDQWIVGINMLSEGVDIPRLRVGVYMTRIRSALYFHQFCGRFTRVQESTHERSFIFLPRDPEIEAIAVEIEKQKAHAGVDAAVVAEYAENIAALPPVTVFYDGTDYWLADGFHRVEAHRAAGKDTVLAEVKQGDRRAAILHSVGANASHGLRRTNADKRRAVELLLRDDEWRTRSERWVSQRCCVSHTFVANLKAQLATVASSSGTSDTSEKRLGQDGKTRKLPERKPREQALAEVLTSQVADDIPDAVMDELSVELPAPATPRKVVLDIALPESASDRQIDMFAGAREVPGHIDVEAPADDEPKQAEPEDDDEWNHHMATHKLSMLILEEVKAWPKDQPYGPLLETLEHWAKRVATIERKRVQS